MDSKSDSGTSNNTNTDWTVYPVLIAFIVFAYVVLRLVQRKTRQDQTDLASSDSGEDEWNPTIASGFVYDNKYRDEFVRLKSSSAPINTLAAALLRRTMVNIGQILEMQSRRQTLQSLVQSGSIGEDVWQSFLAGEKFINEEMQEIIAEAESIKPGWGQTIIPQAQELLRAEMQKQAVEAKSKAEQESKRVDETELQNREAAAARAARELLEEEERASASSGRKNK